MTARGAVGRLRQSSAQPVALPQAGRLAAGNQRNEGKVTNKRTLVYDALIDGTDPAGIAQW